MKFTSERFVPQSREPGDLPLIGELRARLGVAVIDLELRAARVAELTRERELTRAETATELERLGGNLTNAVGERDLARARVLELERACEAAEARLTEAANERERTRVETAAELERLSGRLTDALGERDLARARVLDLQGEVEAATVRGFELAVELEQVSEFVADALHERDAQNALRARAQNELAAMRAELRAATANLERARAHGADLELERERDLAQLAQSSAERESARAETAAALAARDATAVRGVQLELQALSLAGMLEESQGLLRRAEAAARVTAAHLLDARNEAGRLRAGGLELEAQVAGLLAALGRNGAVTRTLGAAVTRAAESLASLELTRLHLEFGLTARVSAAETKAAQSSATALRLRRELSLVAEALALRERRIAMLEDVLRDIVSENVRVLERERSRYQLLLAKLRAGRFFTLRSALRELVRASAKRAGLRS